MGNVNNISEKTSGRRAVEHHSKSSILKAAQTEFAKDGYDKTTLRQIAKTADVNAAMIVHFFGSKQKLFVEAMVPIFEGPKQLPQALEGDIVTLGFRLATRFVTITSQPSTQKLMLGLLKSVSSEEKAAEMLRIFIGEAIINRVKPFLPGKNKELQANILGSQLVGIFIARYIIKIEPLASTDASELIKYLAPRLQAHFIQNT